MLPKTITKMLTRTTVHHKERLSGNNTRIYIPNHTSLLDAVILSNELPKDVVFVANTQIAEKYAWATKGREVLTVNPLNPYSVREMLKLIKMGKSLVVFPEGKITVTNNLMKMYPGVAYLSLKTGVPLVPLAINGGEKAKFFTYLEGKIPTSYFPKTSLYIGEEFLLPSMEGMRMRDKKEKGKELIYRKLQEVLLQSRLIEEPHLIKELFKSVQEAPNLIITEEMNSSGTEKVKMKELWTGVVGLSMLLHPILSDSIADRRVGVLLPTSTACMTTVFSLLYQGKTPAMLNSSMDYATMQSCLDTGDILNVVTSRLFIEKAKLESFVEKSSNRVRFIYLEDLKDQMTPSFKLKVLIQSRRTPVVPASDILLFTSGSEGKPKGVLLSHANILANIQQARLMIDFTSKDKVVNALPMFHSFGLILSFLSPLCLVPTVLVQSPLMYKMLPEIVYDRNATVLFGTSTFLSAYGRHAEPYDFARLRYVFSGAEKLQESVRTLFMDKFGIRVLEGYGLTETSPILALQTPMLYKKDTVGCFVPGVEYKLEKVEGLEEGGKLWIKAPNLMRGYLIPEKGFVPQSPHVYFDTGDIVSIDDKGFVTILGRSKRFVKIAGEMISLALVEEYAKQAIGAGELCAVRILDSKKGERIELVSTSEGVTQNDLREYWNKKQWSPLTLPSKVHYLEELPLLGSGKIDFSKMSTVVEEMHVA